MKPEMFKHHIFGALAGTALLCGCADKETVPASGEGPVAVNFTASIETVAAPPAPAARHTRTSEGDDGQTVWTEGDRVGIFMMKNGGSLPDDIYTDANNVVYMFSSNSNLMPEGDGIYIPQNDAVDFIAYWPHTAQLNAYRITKGLTDQTTAEKQAALDMLYSDNACSITPTDNFVALNFRHVMAKLRFDIVLSERLETGSVTQVRLENFADGAVLDLCDGSVSAGGETDRIDALKLGRPAPQTDASFTALVVPNAKSPGRTIVITVDGTEYTGKIPDKDEYDGNTVRVYPVTVGERGVTVGESRIGDWKVVYSNTGDAIVRAAIETVRIPAGRFRMGSSDGSNIGDKNGTGLNTEPAEPNRLEDEVQHWVTLTKDFLMSRCEITNEQFAEFLNDVGVLENGEFVAGGYPEGLYPDTKLVMNCDNFQEVVSWKFGVKWEHNKWVPMPGYDKHPACYVTWYGAAEYAHWIGGALPSEAQWEYACRAGTDTPFFFGSDINDLHYYAVCFHYQSEPKTEPVGKKIANGYGLYDMYGNVWEWCADWYGAYDRKDVTDPTGPADGDYRITRGCAYYNDAEFFRSAFRCKERFLPTYTDYGIGFRVVFAPDKYQQ